jgi:hypothetical protein
MGVIDNVPTQRDNIQTPHDDVGDLFGSGGGENRRNIPTGGGDDCAGERRKLAAGLNQEVSGYNGQLKKLKLEFTPDVISRMSCDQVRQALEYLTQIQPSAGLPGSVDEMDLSDLEPGSPTSLGNNYSSNDMDLSDLEESAPLESKDDTPSDPDDMDLSDLEELGDKASVSSENSSYGMDDAYPDDFEDVYAERKQMMEEGKSRVNPEYEDWRKEYSDAERKRGEYAVYKASGWDVADLGSSEQILSERDAFAKLYHFDGESPNISKEAYFRRQQEFENKQYARDLLDCRRLGDENHQLNYAKDGSSFMREYPDGTLHTFERKQMGDGSYQVWEEYRYPDGSKISASSLIEQQDFFEGVSQEKHIFTERNIVYQPNAETTVVHSETLTGTISARGIHGIALPSLEDLGSGTTDQTVLMDRAKAGITKNYRHNPWSEE